MALVLGTIAFTDWEVPNAISFGGKQVVIRHRMIGGGAVIDAMGPDDTDIQWDGVFLGPTAELRARRVDLLRRSGRAVLLSWSSFIYRVVVIGFRGDYKRSSHIPYRIDLAVVEDLVSEAAGRALQRIEDAFAASLSDAMGATAGDPVLVGAVAGVQTAVGQFLTGGNYTIAGLGVAAQAGLQSATAQGFATAQSNAAGADKALGASDAIKAGKDPAQMAAAFSAQSEAASGAYAGQMTTAHLGTAQAQLAIPLPPPPAPAVPNLDLPIPLPPPPAP